MLNSELSTNAFTTHFLIHNFAASSVLLPMSVSCYQSKPYRESFGEHTRLVTFALVNLAQLLPDDHIHNF